MNHIAKLKKMNQWLIVYLFIPVLALGVYIFPILLIGMIAAIAVGAPMEIFRAVGQFVLDHPLLVLVGAIFAWLISFLRKRVREELTRHQIKLEKWNAYIRVMEKRLKQRGLEDACGEVQDIGSAVIWRDSAQETAWLKRTLTVIQVCLWIAFGVGVLWMLTQLPEIYTTWHEALHDYDWSPSTGRRWNNDLVSTAILCLMRLGITLIVPAAQLAVSVTAQKNAPDELDLLEMSLRETRKRMEALEAACSAAKIPMDEVWAAARRAQED